MSGYPERWEADVVLRDGGTAHVRPIRPQDADAVQAMHLAQSPESVYLRFFAPLPRISEADLTRFTNVDHRDRVALVMLVGERIIGIGRYDRINATDAEVAFNISDAHQGRGIGSVLLEHLAAAARDRGLKRFVAEVLPQNRKMVGVFRDAGYEVKHHFEDGVIELEFDIEATEKSRAVMEAREHRAEANSLNGLLSARSVVLVGANDDPSSFGSIVLQRLLDSGFQGTVSVIHPHLTAVQGVRAYPRLSDLEDGADLALLAVQPQSVLDMLMDCAAAKVRGIVVYTAGFAEHDPHGRDLQETLVRRTRALGMRLLGPNTLGLVNTAAQVQLNATPAPLPMVTGGLGLFTQSAAIGVAVLAESAKRGLALSSFVSAGNRGDISGNDLMQYWLEDEQTAVVGMYLESSGNPRKFSRVARRLSRAKPTIVVKSGAGMSVPVGQSIRQTLAPAEVFTLMLGQAGVIRAGNLPAMFDIAELLADQPMPAGNRIGLVTNAASLTGLAADAARAGGLEPVPCEAVLTTMSSLEDVTAAIEATLANPDVDAVLFAGMPPIGRDPQLLADAVQAHGRTEKPLLATFLGGVEKALGVAVRVPVFPSVEQALAAHAAVVRYAAWAATPATPLVNPDGIDDDAARALVEAALERVQATPTSDTSGAAVVVADGAVRLSNDDAVALLGHYGIDLSTSLRAHTPEEVMAAADRVGYPVTLKYASRRVRDRLSSAGYRLDIQDADELRDDLKALSDAVSEADLEAGFLVQSMAPHGVPIALISVEDPLFGPVVSFGLHGDAMDLLGDVSHRVAPLTTGDVSQMVREVKASPRLFGYKGSPQLAIDALEDLIARVSRLSDDLPEVARLELSPVIVTEDRLYPLTVRVWVSQPLTRSDSLTRRMT